MRRAAVFTFVLAFSPLFAADDCKPANEFFDGKTTKGWEGKGELWRVVDGAIVGSTEPKGLQGNNTFLCSQKKYKDFELRCKARLKDGKGNSGIQIRSEVIDPLTVRFYFQRPSPGFLQGTSVIGSGLVSLRTLALPYDQLGDATKIVGSGPFVVNGARPAADSGLSTLSAELIWRNGWSAGATFDTQLSDTTRSYAGKGTVRYAW